MRIKLGRPLKIEEIARLSSGMLCKSASATVGAISTDSRELCTGDLYVAIQGQRYNGEDFVQNASSLGAYTLSANKNKADIFHPDTILALQNLAREYKKTLPYLLYNIGITGSVGKTTTKEFLSLLLSLEYATHKSDGNYNNEIGLPLSILSAKNDTNILLMEMGMNHPGEIGRLSKCLEPSIATITNIGTAHIGNLGSRENIAKAKMEITEGMDGGIIIVPHNEDLLDKLQNKRTFSISDPSADYYLERRDDNYVSIYKRGELLCSSCFALSGDHNAKCLIAAVSTAAEAGVDVKLISKGIALISDDNTRQSVVLAKKYIFYSDCYNASLESMISSISSFVTHTERGKRSLLLGDILELGEHRTNIHKTVGKAISRNQINLLFLFGKYSFEIGEGAMENGFPSDRIFIVDDESSPCDIAKLIKKHCLPGEHILMKASRGIRLERILDYFTKGRDN